MEYHHELYGAIKKNHVQEALTLTGFCIVEKQMDLLEQTWVRAVATVGEYTQVCFPKWQDTCQKIVALLTSDHTHVLEAFLITTKLCILYKDAPHYIMVPKLTVPQLRTKVLDVFSESTTLSENGKQLFTPILPKPSNEHAFCCKILGGLIKLWNQKEYLLFRDALEYLCRKDYLIESLPSETEPNISSFLWSFMKVFQKDITDPFYVLYKTGFRKKDKSWRNNFLYGIHNYLHPYYGTMSWTKEDLDLCTKVEKITEDLWAYVIQEHYGKQEQEKEQEEGLYDKLSIFENYYPKAMYDFTQDYTYALPEKEDVKSIHVKKKKSTKPLVESSKEKEIPYNKGYKYPL